VESGVGMSLSALRVRSERASVTSEVRPARPGRIASISALRRYFHANSRPIYSFGATDFNLTGMDEWIGNFMHVCQIDSYDGRHPNVFVPRPVDHDEFESIADIDNYLLSHRDVVELIRRRGGDPVAIFLMFDEKTEELCRTMGMDVWFPPACLRSRCDNKVETVRIGNRAGVPSVPNALGRVTSYQGLRRLATASGLGRHLVVQAPYGDSGHTTFFISSRADWRRYGRQIAAEPEVKVMKRIDPLQATLEACATRSGTVAGPLLTEIVGHPELTPYAGGWAGNEIFPGAFTEEQRAQARVYAERLGSQLLAEGYRGYFDLDFLIDRESGEVYLGELNPRICGASPLTNNAAFAHADAPLFLFHLLEFAGVDYDLDVDELNDRWADPSFIDSWSSVVLKSTSDDVRVVRDAPPSGVWRLRDGGIDYTRFDYRRQAVRDESEGLFFRITGPGDWRYEGADLGILITKGRLMTDEFDLTDRARAWISGLSSRYADEVAPASWAFAAASAAWAKSPPPALVRAKSPPPADPAPPSAPPAGPIVAKSAPAKSGAAKSVAAKSAATAKSKRSR
jgi:biotin carboxylase